MARACPELMAQLYPVLVAEAAKTFLKKGGNGPNGLPLLQEVIAEVFGKDPPPGAANHILAVCRQVVRPARGA